MLSAVGGRVKSGLIHLVISFYYCFSHLVYNAGVVVTLLSDQPTLRDIVCFVVPHVTPRWYDVGVALDVQSLVLDGIVHDHRSIDQPRTMFVKWLQKSPGTGIQARTWKSVLEAIRIICGQGAVAEICTAVHIQGYTTRGEGS